MIKPLPSFLVSEAVFISTQLSLPVPGTYDKENEARETLAHHVYSSAVFSNPKLDPPTSSSTGKWTNKSWGSKWQKTVQQCKKELLRQAVSSKNLTDNVLRKRSQTQRSSVCRKLQNCWDQSEAARSRSEGAEGEANGKDGLQRELSVRMRKVGLLNVFLVTWDSKLFELYNLKSKQGKGCHYVAQANLKLMILQPQMPQGWDHRYETLHLVEFYFFLFFPFLTFYSNKWILAKVYYSSVAFFFYFWACIIHMCMYTCWMDQKSVLPVTSQ